MGVWQMVAERIRHDGWLGLARSASMVSYHCVLRALLASRRILTTPLRWLPGSSETFGPPRRLIRSLRETITRVENPGALRNAPEDACAKLHDSETMSFRKPRTLPGRSDAMLTLPHHKANNRYEQPESFLFSLHRPRVIGPEGMIVTRRDELFGEASVGELGDPNSGIRDLAERRIGWWLVPDPAQDLAGTCIHACGRWPSNYYHWLFDIVARLIPLLRFSEFKSLPLLVPADVRPIQIEVLRQLGFDGPIIPQPGPHVRVEHLLYPSPVRVTHCPPRWILQEMRSALQVPTHHKPGRKIYITRNDARYRRVTNEDDLIARLRPHGFECVRLTGMTFREQIDLFNQSSHVIGANGSSFTNLAFGLPGTRVLELFAPQYVHPAQYALADTLDMEYWFLIGTSDGRVDLRVSLEDVGQVLDQWGMSR